MTRNARYEAATVTTGSPGGPQRSRPTVLRVAPRSDGRGSEISTVADFNHGQTKEAGEYASELQRETRGYKRGGPVKAEGKKGPQKPAPKKFGTGGMPRKGARGC